MTWKLVTYILRILGRRTKCNSEEECKSVHSLHGAGHAASWKGLCTMQAFQTLSWHTQGSPTKNSKMSKYSPFYHLSTCCNNTGELIQKAVMLEVYAMKLEYKCEF